MKLARSILVPAALVAVVALLLLLRGIRVASRDSAPLLAAPAVAVRVARVHTGDVTRWMTLQGTVVAADAADLAPRLTAPVVERRVDAGDRVRRGELLLRLDERRLAAEVDRLEAELGGARAALRAATESLDVQGRATDRDRALAEVGGISREALEHSEAALERARAELEGATARRDAAHQAVVAARERLADARLLAPWDGSVVAVALSPGDLAVVGRPALRLVRDGAHRVRVRLPETATTGLGQGDPVILRHGGRSIEARLARVAAGLDPGGLVVAEVDLDAAPFGLRDGASLEVGLRVASARGLNVPAGALLEGERGAFAFVVHTREAGDLVRIVAVEPLLRGGEATAVRAVRGDLDEGDRVVVAHPSVLMSLADGQAVRVEPAGPRSRP